MWVIGFILGAACSFGFVGAGIFVVHHLAPESERPARMRRLWRWLAKGWAVPMVIWALMNLGLSWWLQPFMPSVQAAQLGGTGGWFGPFLGVMAGGLFIVSTYWLAITLGWELVKVSRDLEGETRSNFRALCATSLVGMLLPALFLFFLGGLTTLGLALSAMFLPAAGYAPTILRRGKKKPMYSAAIARMKFGKYAEAEWEIIRQLENAENDYDGWLMLAELYATQFRDLSESEQIILEVCDQPKVTPSQVSVALHKLADWHLKIGNDPDAARRALQVISLRMPGTHLARMAEARSAQLPLDADELRAQRSPPPIPLPALGNRLDDTAESTIDPKEASATVNQLIERLNRTPNDVNVRERLARLLAEPLGKADIAIEQVELLLGMTDQPDGKRAEWLGLLAAWRLKYQQDEATARFVLERLLREYPNSPQALAAQYRLNRMTAEKRLTEMRTVTRPKIKIVPD